jgi:branched-chain amino acid aminotransferase
VVYRAKYENSSWKEEFIEKQHKTPGEEAAMPPDERQKLADARNLWPDMPLVNYSTQYGLSCFEGLKALPQKNGGLAIFRPDKNAARFHNSMKGLYMPPFPQDMFVDAVVEAVRRNAALGFAPAYNAEWEKDAYVSADSVYIRPFTYSEGAIGVSVCEAPWVVIVCSPVSAYFAGGPSDAVVTDRIRATRGGTGWIKTASNYVISTLSKHDAQERGFMECVYLDAVERKYVEEGSSSNIFFVLKDGTLVTPELGDTILPGITRASIIELAKGFGVTVAERKVSIDEVFGEAVGCFVSGTAAGVTPIQSLTHNGKKAQFDGGKAGAGGIAADIIARLQTTLKGIQYGLLPDDKRWLARV